ncbi:MAG: YhfC family intramembrane metalloprotease [Nanoarchaeota archaeon]|nr:YhfC family intramembrane metalloprotease [Nanoarchaeota archaeon]
MKRLWLLSVILLILPVGFSCLTNSVEVKTSVSVENVQICLILEGKYNILQDSMLYYYSHNDSSMSIKLSNESVVFQSLDSETNWTRIVFEELEYLRLTGSANMSLEENIVVSNLGCCGVYENGQFIRPRESCTETFTVPVVDNSSTWLAILLSFIPSVIIIIYLVKKEYNKYFAVFTGGLGWAAALLLRQPLLEAFQNLELFSLIIMSSLMAGIFEETCKYLILRYVRIARENSLIFGLGWGLTESVIIYVLTMIFLVSMNQAIGLIDALPGAVERVLATALHASLTMIVFKALKDKRLLLIAVFMHFFANVTSTITALILSWNIWIVELIVLLSTVITAYIAYVLNKGVVKNVKKRRKIVKRD